MILKFQAGVAGLPDDEVKVQKGTDPAGDIWVTLWGWDVHLIRTDEGMVVDVWAENVERDAPVATTFAFDIEKEDL